jgi:hypothetical protein
MNPLHVTSLLRLAFSVVFAVMASGAGADAAVPKTRLELTAANIAGVVDLVGALTNLGLLLALMFWPSGDYESPGFGTPRGNTDAAAERIARATAAGFGRRAF